MPRPAHEAHTHILYVHRTHGAPACSAQRPGPWHGPCRAHTHTHTHGSRRTRHESSIRERKCTRAPLHPACPRAGCQCQETEPASGLADPSAARATLRSVSEPGLSERRAQRCYAQSRFQIGLGHHHRNALSGAMAVPLVCCPPCATELSHALLWLISVLHTLLRNDIHRR